MLSVVIPSWNRAGLVGEAIASALAQDPERVEVLLVDDGSTDGTADQVKARFPRGVRVLSLPERSGVGAARNAGVALARGEFLAFLDSDDLWLPGKLKAELDVFASFPAADAVVSDDLRFVGGVAGGSHFARVGLGDLQEARWLRTCPWPWTQPNKGAAICALTLRRRAVDRLGLPLFACDLFSCEDWELQVRLYQACRVVVLPRVFSHIRCIDDGTRIGRACPGHPRSREQDVALLRDRLTVMERSIQAGELSPRLVQALEVSRGEALAGLERYGLSAEAGTG